jgi:hypothetical protein
MLPDFTPNLERIDFAALRALPQRPSAQEAIALPPDAYGAPLYSIPLAPELDGLRKTKATFRAGDVVVHVFGGKDQNKKNWFVGFAPEGGEAQFFKGWKMLRWMVKHGSADFEINGRKFSAHVDGKLKDKMRSRLVVQEQNGPTSSWTMQELSDDAYETGVPVVIAGKDYRMMYTRDFNEDENGGFDGYTGDRSITLLSREGDKMIGFHWFEREIPGDRILVTTPKVAGVDDSQAGTLTLGLRLNNGAFEIYGPSAARP